MATDRRKQLLLAGVLIVLVAVVYRAFVATSTTPAPTSNGGRTSAAPARPSSTPTPVAPDVHLQSLNDQHPKPGEAERNLFQFKPKAPPPPPPSRGAVPQTPAPPPVAAPPPGPPPPPPITLKFISILEQGGHKYAVLSDGLGPPMFGVEGGTVAGRYRILRIGVESIEMSYLDGRGRQTIRLTGQ